MTLIRINKNPSHRQLSVFGATWLVFVGIWGFVASAKAEPTVACVLWILAVVVPLFGALSLRSLRFVYVALSYATYPIGFVVSQVVLACIYYLLLTPTGLIMRLLRYDPLARHFNVSAQTYWQQRTTPKSISSYFRQY